MDVVAGILADSVGRVLLARRPQGKELAGFWEFPGGKVEPQEERVRALVRELHEELAIRVEMATVKPFIRVVREQTGRQLIIHAYLVSRWHGEVRRCEHEALAWCRIRHIDFSPLAPADRVIAAKLAESELL